MVIQRRRNAEIALLCILLARLWLMALPSGLWTDETATAFVAAHPHDPSLTIVSPYTQSIYYALPRAMHAVFGFSEVGYRIPSVLAMGLALFFVARIAARVADAYAAWFAAFACLAIPAVNYFAIDAKPYALGMCCAAGAVYFLVRWLDGTRWHEAIGFLVCAALLWRVQQVYWPFYLVFAVYVVWRMARKETRVGVGRALVVFGTLAIASVPVALYSLSLLREAREHVIVAPPTWRDLWQLLRPDVNLIVVCGAAAAVLGGFRIRRDAVRGSAMVLGLAWWLLAPVTIFAFSRLSGESLFVPRYLSLRLPGVAITAAMTTAMFLPGRLWRTAAVAMAVGALVFAGNWRVIWPEHDAADWRPAAQYVNRSLAEADTPILCASPFIEAVAPVWQTDYPTPGFLYAQLAAYPLRGRDYLLPFRPSDEARDYAATIANETLPQFRRFFIYGSIDNARYWREWLSRQSEMQTWRSSVRTFGEIGVVVFER